MKDVNCAYCMQGDLVAKFAYPICKMDTGFLLSLYTHLTLPTIYSV